MGKLRIGILSLARLVGTSFAFGAGLTYFFDPRSGGRRRALARDQINHFRHVLSVTLRRDLRDLGNRARGLAKDAQHLMANETVDDQVLIERVRSKLGHVYSHARSIEVNAKGNGEIELRGPIDASEHAKVVSSLRLVPGVRAIDDDLDLQAHTPSFA
jgi:hypothetical protein